MKSVFLWRLIAATVGMVLLLGSLAGIALRAIDDADRFEQMANASFEARAELTVIDNASREIEAWLRAHIRGAMVARENMVAASSRLTSALTNMERLAASNAEQQQRVSQLRPLIQSYLEQAAAIIALPSDPTVLPERSAMVAKALVTRDKALEIVRLLNAMEQQQVEQQDERASGSFWLTRLTLIVGTLLAIGALICAVVLIRNAFEARLGTVHRLAEQTRLLRTTIDTMAQGIAVFDTDNRLTLWNEHFLQLMALDAREVAVGDTFHTLVHRTVGRGRMTTARADTIVARATSKLRERQPWTDEIPLEDGRTIETRRVPLPDGSWVATYLDITERKQLDRVKNEFVSTVSHELRTPLTSIRGSLGLVVGGMLEGIPPRVVPLLQIAYANCERLVRLINDILDIEKIESGRLALDLKPQTVAPLIAQAISANDGYFQQFGVQCDFSDNAPESVARVDSDRFIQVMNNLLSNAAKFSPSGSRIEVSLERRGYKLRISVKDKGPGIPEAFRSKIFGRFAQADPSDTRRKGGSGLGLSITKAIVDNMNGDIAFVSQTGEGTTFHVDFPEWVEPEHVPAPLPVVDGLPKLLVIEDEPDTARVIALLLEQGGFSCDIAYDAEMARDRLRTRKYAGVTLDLGLPDENGVQFLRELRADPQTQDLPAIVVSGKASEGRRLVNGGVVGVLDWIDKPIDRDRLLRAARIAASKAEGRLPHLLHVEADDETRRAIAALFAGHVVPVPAASVAAARRLLANNGFDLVLLNLHMEHAESLLPDITPETPLILSSAAEADDAVASRVGAALIRSRMTNDAVLSAIRNILDRSQQPDTTGSAATPTSETNHAA